MSSGSNRARKIESLLGRARRKAAGASACAAICSTALYAAGVFGCAVEEPAPDPVRPVLSTLIADAERMRGRRFSGTARAVNESNLGFEVSGRLIERPIEVGDEVEQGQLLARLDPRDYRAALKSAEAALNRDALNLQRGQSMLAEDVISQVQFDRLAARTDIAEADVELAAKALADSALLAPFSGRVAAIYVENFENVQEKEVIVRVLDISQVEMVVQVPEGLVGSVPYLEELEVRFDPFPDVAIPATVQEIGSEASETTRTYPITLVMTPPEGVEILAGMAGEATGHVILPQDVSKQGLEVPVAAVFADDSTQSDESFVWVVDEATSTVTRRPVEMVSFGEHGAVVRGVEAGDRVVIAGVHSLREGQAVRIGD